MPKSEFELTRFELPAPCSKIVIDPVDVEARLQELSVRLLAELTHSV
jgi:hypothetical protein